MTGFVFPCHPFQPRKVDPDYADEMAAFQAAGHRVHVISAGGDMEANVFPPLPDEPEPLIYRGWMLDETGYARMTQALDDRLITSPAAYLASHHLPSWYSYLADLTLPSEWVSADRAVDHFRTLQDRGVDRMFVKDYVKSVKTGRGSGASSPEDVVRILDDMRTYKGFIEGGIVFRAWAALNEASEVRFFVLNGQVHAPHDAVPAPMLALAHEVAQRHTAPFYTVDTMNLAFGRAVVVELGDGQVSEARGWDLDRFVGIFSQRGK